jgi:hypothetical protein
VKQLLRSLKLSRRVAYPDETSFGHGSLQNCQYQTLMKSGREIHNLVIIVKSTLPCIVKIDLIVVTPKVN